MRSVRSELMLLCAGAWAQPEGGNRGAGRTVAVGWAGSAGIGPTLESLLCHLLAGNLG